MHDFDKNLKTLYPQSITNNDFDYESYDVRQCILTYAALLKLCIDELMDCKSQIMQLTSQINNIIATLDQTAPKCAKRGIIPFLFNFLFGNPNSSAEINVIKNNLALLGENQVILSNQILKTFNFVNLTYPETDTNWLLLKS